MIDWPAVAKAGHSFAFLKATDGVAYRWVDWFHSNLPKVRAAGLVPGAYHFLLDHHPGAAQARYYVAEVNKAGGFAGVVPVVDIEREADGTTPRESHLRDFVAEFRRLIPGRPILIYTGRWYWVGVLGNPPGSDLGPLWHSEYDGLTPIDFDVANGPELERYGGWTDATVWQHTSSGTCPGVSGVCDLNLFYGDRAALLALAGAGTQPAPPDPKEPDMFMVQSNDSGAVLLVTGGASVLIVNDTERKAHEAIGIKRLGVSGRQFAEYEKLRDPVDEAAIGAAVGAAVAAALANLPAGTVDVAAVVAGVRGALAEVKVNVGGAVELAGHLELAEA